jgi:bacterioferritin-associated ferredoxin
MDDKRGDRKQFNPEHKSSVRDASKKTRGFAGLDPTKLGLEGPEWLSTSQSLTEISPEPSLPSDAAMNPSSDVPPEPRTLLEGMKVVCICKGIKKSVFWKVLDTGVQTKEEVNRLTGSGSGGCQGRRCGPRILEMLRNLAK